jgi:hypothetical protein
MSNFNIPPKKEKSKRKCVHMRLYNEIYYGLRGELYNKKLSLQELFQELSFLLIKGDPRIESVVQDIINKKKLKAKGRLVYSGDPNYGECDPDTIYDLIEEGK